MTIGKAINNKRETKAQNEFISCPICKDAMTIEDSEECVICPKCMPLDSIDKALSAPKETEAQNKMRYEEWMNSERRDD